MYPKHCQGAAPLPVHILSEAQGQQSLGRGGPAPWGGQAQPSVHGPWGSRRVSGLPPAPTAPLPTARFPVLLPHPDVPGGPCDCHSESHSPSACGGDLPTLPLWPLPRASLPLAPGSAPRPFEASPSTPSSSQPTQTAHRAGMSFPRPSPRPAGRRRSGNEPASTPTATGAPTQCPRSQGRSGDMGTGRRWPCHPQGHRIT